MQRFCLYKMETRLQSSEVRIPKVESGCGNGNFDLSSKTPTACPYFQSSFARSLSFNQNQSQSLDFELSFRIGDGLLVAANMVDDDDDDDHELYASPPPPLPVTAPPPPLFSTGLSQHLFGVSNNGPQSLPPLHQIRQENDTVAAAKGGHVWNNNGGNGGGMLPITPTKRRFTTNNLNRSHQVSLFSVMITKIPFILSKFNY